MKKYLLTTAICLTVTLSGMVVAAGETTAQPTLAVYDIVPQDQTAEAQAWLDAKGVSVPDSIRSECEAAGMAFGVCPELLEALAWKESRFDATAKNGAYVGLMQMHKTTHAERLSWYGSDPYDAHASIWAAASLIRDLSEEYAVDGEPLDAAVVIGMYHGEDDPYSLSGYTKSIMAVSEALERVHGK